MIKLTVNERQSLLAATLEQLKRATTATAMVEIVRPVARSIAQADGITIVARIGEQTDYLAEDAIGPLWAGLQFPIDKCLAGRAMTQERTVVIADITQAENIPLNVYLGTFIRSLVAVPIGEPRPSHAICAYWQESGPIPAETIALMEDLARGMAATLEMVGSTNATD